MFITYVEHTIAAAARNCLRERNQGSNPYHRSESEGILPAGFVHLFTQSVQRI